MATPSGDLAFKGVRDGAIFPLVTDAVGTLTYDTGYAVTMQEFSMNPDINSAELPGNDVTLDIFSKAKGLTGTIKNAKVHSAFLATLLGAEVGTSANARTIKFDGDDLPGYFKIAVKIGYTGSDSGAVGVIQVYKCKLDSMEFSMNQDDYATFSCNFKAIPTTFVDAQSKTLICLITIHAADVSLLS